MPNVLDKLRGSWAAVLSILLFSCGHKEAPPKTNPVPSVADLELAHRDAWLGAPVKVCWPGNPVCNGNSGLFGGLLCYAGKQESCDFVASLATSAGLLRHPEADPKAIDSSSRDELLGHLITVAKTHDKDHANRLLAVIRGNGGRLCSKSSDTRCSMTGVTWGLMRIVWNHIGLAPTWEMLTANVGDDHTLLIQAQTAPAGFQQHLIAVILLLRQHTNTWNSILSETAETLVNRQPDNEFFQYLVGNEEKAADLLKKHSPAKPLPTEQQKQWWLERATSEEAWKAGSSACVWFMAKLLLKN